MKRIGNVLLILLVVAALATPVYPVAKEIIQIQASLARVEADLRDMRSAMDERMGMMRQVMEQSTQTVSKLNSAIDNVQRSIQGTVLAQGTKVDQMSTGVRGLHDQLEDVQARLGKLSEQMAQMRSTIETLQAPPAPVQQPTAAGPAAGVPPASPETLYQAALRDLNGGKTDMALQQFQDYLRFYPDTELAGNAQFYIGEAFARQRKLPEAVEAYDIVLERYPRGNKTAAAHLKKGLVLIEMNDRDAGARELRELVRRFPSTDEAKIARERLKLMGALPPASSVPARPRPR